MKRLLALLLAGMLLLSACSKDEEKPKEPDPQPQGQQGTEPQAPEPEVGPDGRKLAEQQVYRSMYSGEVTTMNYLVSGTTNDLAVAANTIDCLVEYDSYGNIKPALAEKWETSEDGLKWTFHLRKGVKWVDFEGKEQGEVTANDWVAATEYVLNAQNDSSLTYLMEDWILNAAEYYSWTSTLVSGDPNDEEGNPIPEVTFDQVGVKALDDYTLEYTLCKPRPYFLSALSFGCYFPAYAPLVQEMGVNYALDNSSMYFCGAFILSEFEPQNKRVYKKNPLYWDKDNVFIEEIRQTYNSEAGNLAPEMFLRGQVDYAGISTDLLSEWRSDPEKNAQVSPTRVTSDYSYFFCFNFEPKFDAEYEPENWIAAVNSENFRQSIFHGLDRVKAMSVIYPDNAQDLIENCITPKTFCKGEDGDYTGYGDLAAITARDSFDEQAALDYKAKAIEDIKAAGGHLPVKIPLTYNSSMASWGQECVVVEQQLEALLGSDYIDIIVVAGPSTGFLSEVRRAGKYAMMKCNWGADYADPETWTDPFNGTSSYAFVYTNEEKGYTNKTPETKALNDEYYKLVDEAKNETMDVEARYEKFAKAEAFYINHAFVIPFGVTGGDYQATRLNSFEGQYAVFGLAMQRYKGQRVYETGMGWDAYQEQLAAWQEKMK